MATEARIFGRGADKTLFEHFGELDTIRRPTVSTTQEMAR
jgi:hypothetical protein